MTPEEAIKQLGLTASKDDEFGESKDADAVRLGIEALERLELIREFQKSGNKSLAKVILALLPSETEVELLKP